MATTRTPLMAGNWKMNLDHHQATHTLQKLAWTLKDGKHDFAAVEVAVDGGEWLPAELGTTPSKDTWVQWALTVDLDEGEHELRVRATDKDGLVQTGVLRDVVPDGATGWHTIRVEASAG